MHVGIPYFGGRPGAADVTLANGLLDLFDHFIDPLYRITYDWSEADQVGYVNDPMIPRLTDLAIDERSGEFAVNLEHLSGSEDDRAEFGFLSPTHDRGELQAQDPAVVGLTVLAWLGGRPPEGSTPQRLGVNFSRSAARKELATGGHDGPSADSGEAAFLEFVNLPPFRGQPDVQRHLAEQFVAGQWRSVDLPSALECRSRRSAVGAGGRAGGPQPVRPDPAGSKPGHGVSPLIRCGRISGVAGRLPRHRRPRKSDSCAARIGWRRLVRLADYLGVADQDLQARLRTLESAVRRGRDQLGYGGDLARMLTLDEVREALPGRSADSRRSRRVMS